jgi:hypothetical protein
MSKVLPNQVYAGLFEILKNKNLYYHSSVGASYSHLTDEGKQAVANWINLMGPEMFKLEQQEIDARAKQLVWDELKK